MEKNIFFVTKRKMSTMKSIFVIFLFFSMFYLSFGREQLTLEIASKKCHGNTFVNCQGFEKSVRTLVMANVSGASEIPFFLRV